MFAALERLVEALADPTLTQTELDAVGAALEMVGGVEPARMLRALGMADGPLAVTAVAREAGVKVRTVVRITRGLTECGMARMVNGLIELRLSGTR